MKFHGIYSTIDMHAKNLEEVKSPPWPAPKSAPLLLQYNILPYCDTSEAIYTHRIVATLFCIVMVSLASNDVEEMHKVQGRKGFLKLWMVNKRLIYLNFWATLLGETFLQVNLMELEMLGHTLKPMEMFCDKNNANNVYTKFYRFSCICQLISSERTLSVLCNIIGTLVRHLVFWV